MNAQDLRELLKKSDNQLGIFIDIKILNQYSFRNRELIDLIEEFLTDEEKLELFDYPLFKEASRFIRSEIIQIISDDKIKLQLLREGSIVNDFSKGDIIYIIKTLTSSSVEQLLYDQEFIKKHQLTEEDLQGIVLELEDKTKEEMLSDKNLMEEKLAFKENSIVKFICSIKSDDIKIRHIKEYKIEPCNITTILATLSIKSLCQFFENDKNFCEENNIRPYQVVSKLDSQRQLEFVKRLKDMNMDLNQKRAVLAMLAEDVKEKIDTTEFPEEYKTAIAIKRDGRLLAINPNLYGNLDDYRGLDELISVEPENFTDEQRKKFIELCEICPNLLVKNYVPDGPNREVFRISTGDEYIKAEKWIDEVLSSLKPEYTVAQKIAVIDNAIGRKISYSPDDGTKRYTTQDSQPLWRIISRGYGVCNGIAKVEEYMLARVGIEAETVFSRKHTFLKIKDIELPLANGENARGNTILDPTWNLAMHRFGAMPDNFLISYDKVRQHDIDSAGNDSECHKNDEQLKDATLDLDEQSLRELFSSVGLTNENGQFPIKDLIEESRKIDENFANNPYQNIMEQFALLARVCPEFSMCQNSSKYILLNVLLNNKNLVFNGGFLNRVYDKNDENKSPILFVYIDSNAFGKKAFLPDKSTGRFIEIAQKDFEERYACYEEDIEKDPELQPWREEQKKDIESIKEGEEK